MAGQCFSTNAKDLNCLAKEDGKSVEAVLTMAVEQLNVTTAGGVLAIFAFMLSHVGEIVSIGMSVEQSVEKLISLWNAQPQKMRAAAR